MVYVSQSFFKILYTINGATVLICDRVPWLENQTGFQIKPHNLWFPILSQGILRLHRLSIYVHVMIRALSSFWWHKKSHKRQTMIQNFMPAVYFTVKLLKIWTPEKITVIILKFDWSRVQARGRLRQNTSPWKALEAKKLHLTSVAFVKSRYLYCQLYWKQNENICHKRTWNFQITWRNTFNRCSDYFGCNAAF